MNQSPGQDIHMEHMRIQHSPEQLPEQQDLLHMWVDEGAGGVHEVSYEGKFVGEAAAERGTSVCIACHCRAR